VDVLCGQPMADLLWHYTTGAGLRGILEKNLLWATDVRYMNDESELNYPVSLLDEAFDEALGRLPDDLTKSWISGLRQQLERFETIAVFATCFCRGGPNHGDLLARGFFRATVSDFRKDEERCAFEMLAVRGVRKRDNRTA